MLSSKLKKDEPSFDIESGIKISELSPLMDRCFDGIASANGRPVVLLLGPTGAGKSTVTNQLLGIEYNDYENEDTGVLSLRPADEEAHIFATVGHGWWLAAMGRLKPGWTLEKASAQLGSISAGIMVLSG